MSPVGGHTIQLHIAKVFPNGECLLLYCPVRKMPLGASSSVMKSYLCHVDLSLFKLECHADKSEVWPKKNSRYERLRGGWEMLIKVPDLCESPVGCQG